MIIVHIAPNAPFNDGWGFQDNLLPKYHQKLGHEVTLITTTKKHENGKLIELSCENFISVDGFRVIRVAYEKSCIGDKISNILCKMNVYPILSEIKPDMVFVHGLLSTTIFDVIKYKKIREKSGHRCYIVQDNHADYNIGADPKTLKQRILREYYRLINRKSQMYVERVYGVTPWRKQYAEDYYGINSKKTDLLIMGADDDKINFEERTTIRNRIREKYGVGEKEFLIVTGGKIDEKKKTLLLMEACRDLQNVKLLIFGSIAQSVKEAFGILLQNSKNIVYVGWIAADKVYDYYFAADLVAFPGQHSVLWEQACASKVPCVFARWPGMDHVDNGGNSSFFETLGIEGIQAEVLRLQFTTDYDEMKMKALSNATDIYLYSKIAQKSISDLDIK